VLLLDVLGLQEEVVRDETNDGHDNKQNCAYGNKDQEVFVKLREHPPDSDFRTDER
jgi:hypothetical protein